MELTDLASSSLTGFQESRLTPLPVEVNVTDAEILLGLAFVPSIPIGFEFLDQLKAEITPSLQLPRLDAKLSSKIAENCGNGSNNTHSDAPFANHTAGLSPELIKLGPLALVEANVSLSIDIALDVSLPPLPPPFNAVGIEENIFTAVFPLLSSCASPDDAFNNATGVVIPPSMASHNATAPMLNATMGMARADNTAALVSEEAAAPTLDPSISFIFASDVVSSTSELIATSTPISTIVSATSLTSTRPTLMSSTRSTTYLAKTTSTQASYTAYTIPSLSTTSTIVSETVSTPCTSSLLYPTSTIAIEKTSTTCTTSLKPTSTLIDYTVSATSSPCTTTSTAAYGYTTSSTSPLETTTTPYDTTWTSLTTRTTYITVPESIATSTPCSLTSTLTTNSSTFSEPQYATVLPVYSTKTPVESASPNSSPRPSSSFIPAYNTSSSATPVSSSAVSVTPIASTPIMPENLPPPAPVVTMSVGFLVPSNGSAAPTNRTGLPEFTGAATRVVSVSKTEVMLGWLVGVVGFLAIGALF